MKPKAKFVQLSAISLCYIELGSGTPILFLHGGGLRALTYFPLLKVLSREHLVIAPDLPCFGKSSIPSTAWNFKDYADIIEEFINFMHVDDITVIGHSFGGGVALHLSAKSEKLVRLILIDSAGIRPNYSMAKFLFLFLIVKTINGVRETKRKGVILAMVRDFLLNIISSYRKLILVGRTVKKSLCDKYAPFNKVAVPAMILWGDRDEIFSSDYAEKFHDMIAGSTLEYIHGNHDWCLFEPEKLSAKVGEFCASEGCHSE